MSELADLDDMFPDEGFRRKPGRPRRVPFGRKLAKKKATRKRWNENNQDKIQTYRDAYYRRQRERKEAVVAARYIEAWENLK